MGVELRVETWQKPQICIVVEALRMHLFIQERVEYSGWQTQAHKPNLASANKVLLEHCHVCDSHLWRLLCFIVIIEQLQQKLYGLQSLQY